MGNARTKGRFIGLFVAILFVLQLPLLLTTQAQATATKGEFPYITGVTLTDPTTGEDLSGETDVSKDANVKGQLHVVHTGFGGCQGKRRIHFHDTTSNQSERRDYVPLDGQRRK